MFNVDREGIITLTRGDSFRVPLFINQGTSIDLIRYIINDKSEIYMAVTEPNQPFELALIKKKYTSKDLNENGDIEISFNSEDTANVLPGKYYYQIKAKLYDEEKNDFIVNTIIPKTQFFIIE